MNNTSLPVSSHTSSNPSSPARPKVLYLSYDGMLEPLGQSQVLSYLEQLSQDAQVHLISFEKPADRKNQAALSSVQARIQLAGINWHPLVYHKRPSALATAFDIFCGILLGTWVVLRYRLRIVHARSYVAAVMALAIKRLTGARFIFDMRGFWADERVDGGLWSEKSALYRVAKYFERRFLLRADQVISLTQAAVQAIQGFPYLAGRLPSFTVIPTCADLKRFRPLPRSSSEAARPAPGFVLGYVGSAGTWYVFEAVVSVFAKLRRLRPNARLLVLNRSDHAYIREQLQRAAIPEQAVEIRAASHAEVPMQIARMDAGIFFYKPGFSRKATAPTKLAEFLGCGVPCLSNAGVGDMANILRSEQVGVAVESFDEPSLDQGLQALLALCGDPAVRERCIEAAARHFSLAEGVRRYRAVWQGLMR